MPMDMLGVGPGEPGPEDEWKFPAEPLDKMAETAVGQTNGETPQEPEDKG